MRTFIYGATLFFITLMASTAVAFEDCSDALIAEHLRDVVTYLSASDVSDLTLAQQTNRRALLGKLAIYAETGEFPENLELHRKPIFIDDHGTACAVGHLMLESGAEDMANEIQAYENFAYVPEISHPDVSEWAKVNGFTLDELTWIQPAYCGESANRLLFESFVSPQSHSFGDAVYLHHITRSPGTEPTITVKDDNGSMFPGNVNVLVTEHSGASFPGRIYGFIPNDSLPAGQYTISAESPSMERFVQTFEVRTSPVEPTLETLSEDFYEGARESDIVCCEECSDACCYGTSVCWARHLDEVVGVSYLIVSQTPDQRLVRVTTVETANPDNATTTYGITSGRGIRIDGELKRRNTSEFCSTVAILDGGMNVLEEYQKCYDEQPESNPHAVVSRRDVCEGPLTIIETGEQVPVGGCSTVAVNPSIYLLLAMFSFFRRRFGHPRVARDTPSKSRNVTIR